MKVFLDTNVLASALATRGLCADLLEAVLVSHQLVLSQLVLDELHGVLIAKFGVPHALANEALRFVADRAILAATSEPLPLKLHDKNDLSILTSARAVASDAFVTGDKELQDIGQIGEMRIFSPRGFWQCLQSQAQ